MRVLIVDDSGLMRQMLEVALTADPAAKAFAVDSGARALDAAREWHPDVILLDSEMPGMDGGETLEALQRDEQTAAIPVIMVTANDRAGTRERFERLGAVAVIQKPFAVDTLARQVSALLVGSH